MRLPPFLNFKNKIRCHTKRQLFCVAVSVFFLVQCGKTDDTSVSTDSTESYSSSALIAIDLKRIDLHLFNTPGFYLKDTLLISGGTFEGDYSRLENENGDLRYRVSTIHAEPGEVVLITISVNSSERDANVHNWVLLDKNLNKEKVQSLLFEINDEQVNRKSVLEEFIIESSDDVMYRGMDSVNFEAPKVKGRYIYLCTHPEHFERGEYGYFIIL